MRIFISLLLMMIFAAPVQSANVLSPRYSSQKSSSLTSSARIYDIRPSEVARYIKKQPQKKLVYVYASWCPYCKRIFPEIIKMGQKGVKVIAFSVDSERHDLERYLASYGRSVAFPTLRVKNGPNSIGSALAQAGLSYPGTVPYMAVIDKNNKILLQGSNLDASTLWSYLKR